MKYILSLLFMTISFLAQSQTITPEQAKDSVGKKATICGEVTGTHTTETVTFLNLGGKYPNNAFTVVVFKDAAAKFSYQLSTLEGKNICVTGMVKDYKGKPEMVVENEREIDKK